MRFISIEEAQSDLAELVEAVLAGEQVVIVRDGGPIASLEPMPTRRFRIGLLKGQLTGPVPDFMSPMNADDLATWEGRP